MTLIGYTMMCEQAGPKQLVRDVAPRRASGLRLRGHQRPLLPVARLARPLAVRVERARRGRAGDHHIPDDYVTCPIRRYHPAVVAQKAPWCCSALAFTHR